MPGTIYLQRPTPTWQAVGPTMATDLFRTLLARNMRSQLMHEEADLVRERKPLPQLRQVYDPETKTKRWKWLQPGEGGISEPPEVVGDEGTWYQGYRLSMKDGKPYAERATGFPEKKEDVKPPTVDKIKAGVLQKWLANQNLTPKEQKVLDKHFAQTRQTPEEVKAKVMARLAGKRQWLEVNLGRKLRPEEVRFLAINDIYGMLAPQEESLGISDEDYNYYKQEYGWSREEVDRRYRLKMDTK